MFGWLLGGKLPWKKLVRLLTGLSAKQIEDPVREVLENRMTAEARKELAGDLRVVAERLDTGDTAGAAKRVASAVGKFKV